MIKTYKHYSLTSPQTACALLHYTIGNFGFIPFCLAIAFLTHPIEISAALSNINLLGNTAYPYGEESLCPLNTIVSLPHNLMLLHYLNR